MGPTNMLEDTHLSMIYPGNFKLKAQQIFNKAWQPTPEVPMELANKNLRLSPGQSRQTHYQLITHLKAEKTRTIQAYFSVVCYSHVSAGTFFQLSQQIIPHAQLILRGIQRSQAVRQLSQAHPSVTLQLLQTFLSTYLISLTATVTLLCE